MSALNPCFYRGKHIIFTNISFNFLNYNRFLGYTRDSDHNLIQVEEEARIVRRIFSEFLFQKLLFSFLSFKERGYLNVIYDSYKLTPYGKDKLGIDYDSSFVNFYQKVKEYTKREYGASLPYKIDYKQSKSIYQDFDKMIILAEKGNE